MNRIMLAAFLLALLLAALFPGRAVALESGEIKMREDLGMEPLWDCYLNYYYYTPCPTYSWFWWFTGWDFYDKVGAFFQVGDISMSTGTACDPHTCFSLERIRVLDFAGYGQVHPSVGGVIFDVYCCDEYGCPVGPSLWNSGEYWTGYAWNYVDVTPPLCLSSCAVGTGPISAPRLLVTATHIGRVDPTYPAWGFDNVSTPVMDGCELHESSCMPTTYPRPYNSYYARMHSGFYGQDFEYCPPLWFRDWRDSTPDAAEYGYIEICWRVYLVCSGPTDVQPTTWGNIKSMYR
jgi:hypothetical protein